jgi:hypothetical protein
VDATRLPRPRLFGFLTFGAVRSANECRTDFPGNCVVLVRLKETFAIAEMDRGFMACKEASSNPSACSAQRQRRGKATPIRYAAGGDHRCRRNSIHHRRYEGHSGYRSADMTARLPTLGNDDVDAAVYGLPGGGCRIDSV